MIPVRCSDQLSYEATDVGSWSFVSSNEPAKNGRGVIYVDVDVRCGVWVYHFTLLFLLLQLEKGLFDHRFSLLTTGQL